VDIQTWKSAKRVAAFLAGVAVLYLSFKFSVDGFSFDSPDLVAAGYLLAGVVFAVELVFSDSGILKNPTLFVSGIVAYAYGISTNVIGLANARSNGNWQDPITLIAGVFMDVLAEPLLVYGITGTLGSGDLLKNVLSYGKKVNPLDYDDGTGKPSVPRKSMSDGLMKAPPKPSSPSRPINPMKSSGNGKSSKPAHSVTPPITRNPRYDGLDLSDYE
jgi:hypothetical protein